MLGRSRSHLLYLFQEVDVRLIGNPCPLHRLPQLIADGKLTSVVQAVPLKDYYELVGVVGVAQDPSPLGAPLLSGGSMIVVEYRLPPLVILYLMAHKQVRHGSASPFRNGLSRATMMPLGTAPCLPRDAYALIPGSAKTLLSTPVNSVRCR